MARKRLTHCLMWLLLLVGLAVGGFGVRHLAMVSRCRSWPTVVGVVSDASLKPMTAQDQEDRRHDDYVPQLVYEYSVEGRGYFSDGISNQKYHRLFGMTDAYYAGSEEAVLELLSRYPIGQPVTVYYDPAAPARAILDPGLKLPNFLPFIVGLLMIYLACHLYLFGFPFGRRGDGSCPA